MPKQRSLPLNKAVAVTFVVVVLLAYVGFSWRSAKSYSFRKKEFTVVPAPAVVQPFEEAAEVSVGTDNPEHYLDDTFRPFSAAGSANFSLRPISINKSIEDRAVVTMRDRKPVRLVGNVGPGLRLHFLATYLGGPLVFELVGHMHYPSHTSHKFQTAVDKTVASRVVHLHIRLGSAPRPAVANAASPGLGWMHEEPLTEMLDGAKNKPIVVEMTFRLRYIEVLVNDRRLIHFKYRFDPMDIDAFQFLCEALPCIRHAQVAIIPPASPAQCFPAFCPSDVTTPAKTAAMPAVDKGTESPSPVGIEHSFYINLAHRTDRRATIEGLLTNASIPFSRLEAINLRQHRHSRLLDGCFDERACPGQVGCQLSHLTALRRAMDAGWDHVAIFEDDFTFQPFVDLATVQPAVAAAMRLVPEWEVIALSLNILAETRLVGLAVNLSSSFSAELTWLHSAQTTGGYIVRRAMMPRIYEAFLPDNCPVKRNYATAIDTCWKTLQVRHIWIAFEPQPGTQAQSFSDIENRQVNYGLAR